MSKKLAKSFYRGEDVVSISKNLLGKVLVTNFSNKLTSGTIIETEAYKAPEDKASHAYENKRTPRTETMFSAGGCCYVYLCYGMHNLFNVVTGPKDIPHAVLIRAIDPIDGIDIMLKRRKLKKLKPELTNGPAKLTQALGISVKNDMADLSKNLIWIEDRGIIPEKIIACPRVGIPYAQEYIKKTWRFKVK